MKTSFSLNAFSDIDIESAIKILSKIGYEGIELVLDIPHVFLPIKDSRINEIKNTIRKSDINVSNLNSNTVLGFNNKTSSNPFEPSLSNVDEKLRSWRIFYTKQAIDLAEKLESPSICITSGVLHPKNTIQEFQFFKNSLEILSKYAEKKHIKIAIEFEPGLLINNTNDVWKLILNDYSNIGLNLDTCHAAVNDENIPKIIQKFNRRIFHTHISDCKDRIHYHLLPGLGDIDFQHFYTSLKEIGYGGFLTAELYTYSKCPLDAASKAFIYLKNLIK